MCAGGPVEQSDQRSHHPHRPETAVLSVLCLEEGGGGDSFPGSVVPGRKESIQVFHPKIFHPGHLLIIPELSDTHCQFIVVVHFPERNWPWYCMNEMKIMLCNF